MMCRVMKMFSCQNMLRGRLFALVIMTFCSAANALTDDIPQNPSNATENRVIRLATTTSTDNSGLLEQLLPLFELDSDYSIQVISVGSGKALRLGQSGDVDVLLVHAPQSEEHFVDAGYGILRKNVMVNDFVLVGPKNDPAGLRHAKTTSDAFSRVQQSASIFISRGDDSGTHKKEISLWKSSNLNVLGKWYREVGQGMGKSLQIADELQAYLLIDRATWIFQRQQTSLALLYQGDNALHNPYSVIAVNPKRHRTNFTGSVAFIDWLTSPKAQAAIADYAIDGMQLFTPTAEQ